MVSLTDSHHHASSTCQFVRGTYTRARHHASSTCYPRQVPCMQGHKTRQTQASRLLIFTGPQNPRPVLGKPRHGPIGLTKPKENTPLVQGLTNPRSTHGEPSPLLSSIPSGTQDTQGLPLTIFHIPNFYLCMNTCLSKTQGLSLVLTSPKPKVHPWYKLWQNPRFALGTKT